MRPQLTPDPDSQQAFAQFFTHRGMLRAYLQAMLRDSDLVDDTLSDVAIEVARCWDAYDPTFPFGPWVRGMARRLALKRLRGRRRVELGLPDDVLESLGLAMDQIGDRVSLDGQKQQLRQCLERLSSTNRELVRLRYFEEQRLEAIAAQEQRSMGALYTAFSRIHAALLRCMEKAEARETSIKVENPPPFEAMLRLLNQQLPPAELAALTDRLRGDATARRQAAGLLLQIGLLGELARPGDHAQMPLRARPAARSPGRAWRTTAIVAACSCLVAAAALILVIGKRRPAGHDGRANGPSTFARQTSQGRPVRALAPAPAGTTALLVRGGDPEVPGPGDLMMIRRLEGLGFEVTHALDANLSEDDLSGKALIVISASTSGNVVRDQLPRLRLRDAPVPIVSCETTSFDLLGMTGPRVARTSPARNGFGAAPDHTALQIQDAAHPLAAGLRGRISIATAALSWGAPSPNAVTVATLVGTGQHMAAQFAYERGATMVGMSAPARRVGCFVSSDAGDSLTPEAWQLFDAGVRWAIGL